MSQNNNSHRLPIQLADQFVPSCCYLVVANNILSSHCVLRFCYNGVIRPPRSSIVIVQFPIESGRCHSDDLADSHADIFDGYVHVRLLKQIGSIGMLDLVRYVLKRKLTSFHSDTYQIVLILVWLLLLLFLLPLLNFSWWIHVPLQLTFIYLVCTKLIYPANNVLPVLLKNPRVNKTNTWKTNKNYSLRCNCFPIFVFLKNSIKAFWDLIGANWKDIRGGRRATMTVQKKRTSKQMRKRKF